MTGTYKVRITDTALEDMESIYNYIAVKLHFPQYALNQYDRIADKIESLKHFPERAPIIESESERPKNLRKLFIDNYIIFFTCKDCEVIVLRVLYGASDVSSKLRQL